MVFNFVSVHMFQGVHEKNPWMLYIYHMVAHSRLSEYETSGVGLLKVYFHFSSIRWVWSTSKAQQSPGNIPHVCAGQIFAGLTNWRVGKVNEQGVLD